MIINFACHIYNRAFQLKETLGLNLEFLLGTVHKLTLVDFQSTDEIMAVIQPFISHPNFCFHQLNEKYNIGNAKNKASLIEECDYVFNLDCDNFISKELISVIEENSNLIIRSRDLVNRSTTGRIGFPKNIFLELNGYPVFKNYLMGEDYFMFIKVETFYRHLVKDVGIMDCKMPIDNGENNQQERTKMFYENIEEYKDHNLFIPHRRVTLLKDTVGGNSGVLKNYPGSFHNRELKYKVKFLEGFDFSLGGKLPGIGLGIGTIPPYGGVKRKGWSTRIMWREHGQVEVYFYHKDQKGQYGDSFLFPICFEVGDEYTISYGIQDDHVLIKLNEYEIRLKLLLVGYNHILYHVYRGGKDLGWSSATNDSIDIYQ